MRSHRSASAPSSGSEKRERNARARPPAGWCAPVPAVASQGLSGRHRSRARHGRTSSVSSSPSRSRRSTRRVRPLRESWACSARSHMRIRRRPRRRVVEHLIGGHRQSVLALQLGVQALGQARVSSQQAAPRAELAFAERLLLPWWNLDCGRGRHDDNRYENPAQSNIAASEADLGRPRAHDRVARQAQSIVGAAVAAAHTAPSVGCAGSCRGRGPCAGWLNTGLRAARSDRGPRAAWCGAAAHRRPPRSPRRR